MSRGSASLAIPRRTDANVHHFYADMKELAEHFDTSSCGEKNIYQLARKTKKC